MNFIKLFGSKTVQQSQRLHAHTRLLGPGLSASQPESTVCPRKMATISNTVPHLQVGHDVENNEFYIQMNEDSSKHGAVLQYAWVEPGIADLYHTEVPPKFRGKGVAKLLAKAAMDHIVQKDAKMILSCTYLQKYVRDHPEPEYMSRTINM